MGFFVAMLFEGVLKAIDSAEYLSFEQVRLRFGREGSERARTLMETYGLLQFASERESGTEGYVVSTAGKDLLSLHRQRLDEQKQKEAGKWREKEEERAHEAEQTRKDHHHDYLVSAFNIFLGFLIGLFAEHYGQIIAFVNHLFGSH